MQVIVTANTGPANKALALTDKQMKKTATTSSMLSSRLSTAVRDRLAKERVGELEDRMTPIELEYWKLWHTDFEREPFRL